MSPFVDYIKFALDILKIVSFAWLTTISTESYVAHTINVSWLNPT